MKFPQNKQLVRRLFRTSVSASLVLLAVAGGTGGGGVSLAEQQMIVRDEYYEVRGATLDQVWQDMRRKTSSKGGPGGVHPGFTNRSMVWSFGVRGISDLCTPTRIKVTANIVRHLPKWVGGPLPLSEEGKEWTRFVKALAEHEDGHVKIGLQVAREVEEAMLAAGEKPLNCAYMKIAIEAAAQKAVAQGKRLDKLYDHETKHGRAQGAVLTVKDRSWPV